MPFRKTKSTCKPNGTTHRSFPTKIIKPVPVGNGYHAVPLPSAAKNPPYTAKPYPTIRVGRGAGRAPRHLKFRLSPRFAYFFSKSRVFHPIDLVNGVKCSLRGAGFEFCVEKRLSCRSEKPNQRTNQTERHEVVPCKNHKTCTRRERLSCRSAKPNQPANPTERHIGRSLQKS